MLRRHGIAIRYARNDKVGTHEALFRSKCQNWAGETHASHDLVALYPKDTALAQWAAAVHQLYVEARSFTHPQAQRRRTAQLAWERQLLVIPASPSWLTR